MSRSSRALVGAVAVLFVVVMLFGLARSGNGSDPRQVGPEVTTSGVPRP